MDDRTKQVLQQCSAESLAGTITFPEVVRNLASVGCEQYHADFRCRQKTYYLDNGETHDEQLPVDAVSLAPQFDGVAIVSALRQAQAGNITYREFIRKCVAAGCVGYFVYIAGRRAIYLGRTGEMHIEMFPVVAATSN